MAGGCRAREAVRSMLPQSLEELLSAARTELTGGWGAPFSDAHRTL